MTIASETSRVDLVGDGANDTFTFTFEIYVKTDLLVYVGGIQQTVDIEFTVADEAIENPDGGTIVFGAEYIPALDAVVSIILNLPYTQLIDYVEADKFPAETHERGLDRLVKIAQQHKEKLSRTPSLAISSALSDLIIPEAASRAIGWDALGEELTTYPITPVLDANWDSIQNYDNDLATAVAEIGAGAKTLLIDVSTESVIANLEIPETLELYPIRTGLITVDNCVLTIGKLSKATGFYKIFNCINGGTVVFGSGAVEEADPEWWITNTTPGTTNMYAAIQAALDSGADIVPLLDTTYRYDTGLIVLNEKLRGKGSYRTFLEYNTEEGTAITLCTQRGAELSGFTLTAKGTTQAGILVEGNFPVSKDIRIEEFDGISLRFGIAGVVGCLFADTRNVYVTTATNTGTEGLRVDGPTLPNSNANSFYNVSVEGKFTTLVYLKGDNNNWYGGNIAWGANTPTDVVKIDGIGNQINNVYMEGVGEATRVFHFPSTSYRNQISYHNQGGASNNVYEKTTDSGWANEITCNGSIGYNYKFPVENKGIENLIPNSHFKNWNVDGNAPVGWKKIIDTVAKESTIIKGADYAVKLTGAGATNPMIYCYLNDSDSTNVTEMPIAQFQGETILAGVWCKTTVAGAGNIKIHADGTGGTGWGSDKHTGGGGWEFLTVMGKVPADATYVYVSLKGEDVGNLTGDVYFSEPIAVKGCHLPKPDPRSLNDSHAKMNGPFVGNSFINFVADDATPSVKDGNNFKTANANATTVTMFDDGYEGQVIRIIITDVDTTIDFTGTNLEGNVGVDWTPTIGDWMEGVFDGTNWYCSVHDCTA